MLEFAEPQTVFTLLSANPRVGIRDAEDIVGRLREQELVNLSDLLVDLAVSDEVEEKTDLTELYLNPDSAYGSVLRLKSADGSTRKLYHLSIRDATLAALLPLVGLVAAVATANGIAMATSLATVVNNVWKKLKRLELPSDSDALEVFEAIAASEIHPKKSQVVGISTADLAKSLFTNPDAFNAALAKLVELGLVEVQWADQSGDIGHIANIWRYSK
jgi:hypothetical protein